MRLNVRPTAFVAIPHNNNAIAVKFSTGDAVIVVPTRDLGKPTMHEAQSMRGFVVLVVDDDPDNLELATMVVESFGCSVLKASSCDDALSILDSGAHVDLVFSDVVMPKSSGIALARLARERRPSLPIVLATGFPDAIDDVTDSGAIPLIKPYSIPRLEAVFAEHLHVDDTPPA